MIARLYDCDACLSQSEERVFTDSWTGKALCLACLTEFASNLSTSPAYEGDNLDKLIHEAFNA